MAEDAFVAGTPNPSEHFGELEGPFMLGFGALIIVAIFLFLFIGYRSHKKLGKSLDQLEEVILKESHPK